MNVASKKLGWLSFAAALLAAALAGCSGSDTLPVTGNATFDGVPIEKGEISFIPVAGGGPSEGGVIENGAFAFRAKPGSKRVEIRASRPLPPERQTQPEMGLMYEDYIPATYNRDSKLTAEVAVALGDGQFHFDLKSQPP